MTVEGELQVIDSDGQPIRTEDGPFFAVRQQTDDQTGVALKIGLDELFDVFADSLGTQIFVDDYIVAEGHEGLLQVVAID